MRIQRFVTADMREAIRRVREALGPEAVILSSRRTDEGMEVTAAIDYEEAPAPAPPGRAPAPALDPDGLSDDVYVERPRGPQPPARPGTVAETYDAGPREPPAPAADEESTGARPTVAAPGRAADVDLGEVEREIRCLRALLEEQVGRIAWNEEERRNPLATELRRRFAELGLRGRLADALVATVPPTMDAAAGWGRALGEFASRLDVTGDEVLERGGIVALVGPTGVGKTTTVAKLAARFALRHGSDQVALVTTDSFRIGAHEQLRTFGRIIDIPVQVASDEHELRVAIEQFYDRRLILVDTAGMGQRDVRFTEQIELIGRGTPGARIYLVLSATTHYLGLREAARAFRSVGIDGCVITKVDESTSLGDALSVVIEEGLPVAYVSNGQRIPEDLFPAGAHGLVREALAMAESYSQAEAELRHPTNPDPVRAEARARA